MTTSAGNLGASFRFNAKDALSEIAASERALSGLGSVLQNTGRMATDAGVAMTVMGAAGLAANTGAVMMAANIEHAMARVFTVGDLTVQQMKQVEKAIFNVGRGVKGPKEVAGALFNLASAGLETAEQLAALPTVIQLAVASNIDLAASSQILVQTMAAFNIEAKDSARIANVIAASNAVSSANAERLAEAYKTVAASAAAFGVSLEDTTAALNILINVFQNGEMAGTGLRNVLTRLSSGTTELRNAARAAGIPLRELNPAVVGASAALHRMNDLLEAGANAYDLFGDRGQTAANILAANIDQYDDMVRAISGTNAAQGQFDIMAGTVVSRFAELRNSIESTVASYANVLRPFVVLLINVFKALVDVINAVPDPLKNVIVFFGLFHTTIALVNGPLMAMGGVLARSVGWFIKLDIVAQFFNKRLADLIKKTISFARGTNNAAKVQDAWNAAVARGSAANATYAASLKATIAANAAKWRAFMASRKADKMAAAERKYAAAQAQAAAAAEANLARARSRALAQTTAVNTGENRLNTSRLGLNANTGIAASQELVLYGQRVAGAATSHAAATSEAALGTARGLLNAQTTTAIGLETALTRARAASAAMNADFLRTLYRAWMASRGLGEGLKAEVLVRKQLTAGTAAGTAATAASAAATTTATKAVGFLQKAWKALIASMGTVGKFMVTIGWKIGIVVFAIQSLIKSFSILRVATKYIKDTFDDLTGGVNVFSVAWKALLYVMGVPFKIAGQLIASTVHGWTKGFNATTYAVQRWGLALAAVFNPSKWATYRADVEALREEFEETNRMADLAYRVRTGDIWGFETEGLEDARYEVGLFMLDMEKVARELPQATAAFDTMLDAFSFEYRGSPLQRSLVEVDEAFQERLEQLDDMVKRFPWMLQVDVEGNKIAVDSDIQSFFGWLEDRLREERDALKSELVLAFTLELQLEAEAETIAAMRAGTDKILAEYNFREDELERQRKDALDNVGTDLAARAAVEEVFRQRSANSWQQYLDDVRDHQDNLNRIWAETTREVAEARVNAMEEGEAKIRAQFALRAKDLDRDRDRRLEEVEGNALAEREVWDAHTALVLLLTGEMDRAIAEHHRSVAESLRASTAAFEDYVTETGRAMERLRVAATEDPWQALLLQQLEEGVDAQEATQDQLDQIYADAVAGIISISEANRRAAEVTEQWAEHEALIQEGHLVEQRRFLAEREQRLLEHAETVAAIYRDLAVEGIEDPVDQLRAGLDAELAALEAWRTARIAGANQTNGELDQIEDEYQARRHAAVVTAERAITKEQAKAAEERARELEKTLTARAQREASTMLDLARTGVAGVVTMADLKANVEVMRAMREELVKLGATPEMVNALTAAIGDLNTMITDLGRSASEYVSDATANLTERITELREALYFSEGGRNAAQLQRTLDGLDLEMEAHRQTLRTMYDDDQAYEAAVLALEARYAELGELERERANRVRIEAEEARAQAVLAIREELEAESAGIRIEMIEDAAEQEEAAWAAAAVARRAALDAQLEDEETTSAERIAIVQAFNDREAALEQQRQQNRQRAMREFIDGLAGETASIRARLMKDSMERERAEFEIARAERQKEAMRQIDLYARTFEEREAMLIAFQNRELLLEREHVEALAAIRRGRMDESMAAFVQAEGVAEGMRASAREAAARDRVVGGVTREIKERERLQKAQNKAIEVTKKEIEQLKERNQELLTTIKNVSGVRSYFEDVRELFDIFNDSASFVSSDEPTGLAWLEKNRDVALELYRQSVENNLPLQERIGLLQNLKALNDEVIEAGGRGIATDRGLFTAAQSEYRAATDAASDAAAEWAANDAEISTLETTLAGFEGSVEILTTALDGLGESLTKLNEMLDGKVWSDAEDRFLDVAEAAALARREYVEGLSDVVNDLQPDMSAGVAARVAESLTRLLERGDVATAVYEYMAATGEHMPEWMLEGLLGTPMPGDGAKTLAEKLGVDDEDLGAYVEDAAGVASRRFAHAFGELPADAPDMLVEGVGTALDGAGPDIDDKVDDAGATAGKGLMQAFADGITSNRQILLNAVEDVLADVRLRLPSSDAKRGPLSDLTGSGKSFVRTWVGGAESQSGYLAKHIDGLLGGAAITARAPGMTRYHQQAPGGAGGPLIGQLNVDGRTTQPTGIMDLSARQLVEAVRHEVRAQSRMR